MAGAARRLLGGIGRRALDLVLPPVCLACRAPVGDPHSLCALCWSGLRFVERPYCERLGIPFAYDLGPGALSAEAIADPPPYAMARTAVLYDGPAHALVQGLKYRDRIDIARLIGRLTVRAAGDLLPGADVVMPLPLHWRRFLTRRYNQSALIADAVARAAGLPLNVTALRRMRATRPQVGLQMRERAANVAGVFQVVEPGVLAGRTVILVDDVITTGATLASASRALLRGGARQVRVLAFARVPTGALKAAGGIAEAFDFG